MKQVFLRQGTVAVEEVPAPMVEPGTVLVRVASSCISVGTEISGLRHSGTPLWKRALADPGKVRDVLAKAATRGVGATRQMVKGKLEAGHPTGYSAAGTVIEAGAGAADLSPGQRVACAGAEHAFHAEVVRVPRNLVVPVPEALGLPAASTVTLGAIALQGVRRCAPTLGETIVVLGLGVLGLLTVQLLRSSGCRVIGIDLDRRRLDLARKLGLDVGLHPEESDNIDQVARLTDGVGADGVIITAAASSDAIVASAFRMSRRKGRVVLVGDVGLHLQRDDIYAKELDFLVSTSYGPGRYDTIYEERGLEYPVAYVRWTENRNMGEYLRQLAEGRVTVEPMIERRFPVAEAPAAYAALQGEGDRPLMVLLTYPESADADVVRRIPNPAVSPSGDRETIGLAVVGAGEFARGMHLANLMTLKDRYRLQAVLGRSGHSAQTAAKQFGAAYATTDLDQVLRDTDVDALLIATRHHLHADQALAGLRAGKHVLLEKPLALTGAELERFREFYGDGEAGKPLLLTGFNRRFSPLARRLHDEVRERSNPMILDYRMNAGHLPATHWTQGPEGGGRNLGEACHIYDLFTYLTGAAVTDLTARAIVPATGHYSPRDNFVATIAFEDGSLATLTYTSLGAKEHPKETLEVFCDGRVLTLDDYVSLRIAGPRGGEQRLRQQDKGHLEELAAFAAAIRGGGEWPIPLWQQLQATAIALRVEGFLPTGPGPAPEREAEP